MIGCFLFGLDELIFFGVLGIIAVVRKVWPR